MGIPSRKSGVVLPGAGRVGLFEFPAKLQLCKIDQNVTTLSVMISYARYRRKKRDYRTREREGSRSRSTIEEADIEDQAALGQNGCKESPANRGSEAGIEQQIGQTPATRSEAKALT